VKSVVSTVFSGSDLWYYALSRGIRRPEVGGHLYLLARSSRRKAAPTVSGLSEGFEKGV
jgi:hypothetical protein